MTRIREKLAWALAAALGLFVVATLAGVVRGGPLDPTGPPAPTQPQVEPRTPISSLPYTISQSGSYFLTKNLSSGAAGITVQASDVTIDLGGFTMLNGGPAAPAVNVSAGYSHLVVRNGTIDGWFYGIQSSSLDNSRFEELQFRGASLPINATGAANVVENVSADRVSYYGFWLGDRATVSDCRLDHIADPGNQHYGIIGGVQSVVTRCSTDGFGFGIAVSDHSQVADCNVSGGIEGLVLGAAASAQGCTVASVSGQAIIAPVSSEIIDNLIDNPGGIGILVTGAFARIEGNQIVLGDNKKGIYFNGGSNLNTVLRNRIRVGVNTIAIDPGSTTNDIGPIQSAATGSSPNANIVY